MTYIPDCRTHEVYNFDNLSEENKRNIIGYDWCAEMVVDNFFNNLDVYFAGDSYLMHILNEKLPEELKEEYEFETAFADGEPEVRKVETYADLLRSKLLDWIEDERDTLITSMIDDQGTAKADEG